MTAEMETAATDEAKRHLAESVTVAEPTGTSQEQTNAEPNSALMELVVDADNMRRAYRQVLKNQGAAGVDGLEVSELKGLLQPHWPSIKAKLLAGLYQPQPVRRVRIPKPNGGERELGIPTVLDRLIQQALHQVLSPLFEPTFSDHSYGYRPGRSAHQAVQAAQGYVAEGAEWVVDVDLEKFFDRVNHDMLMTRVHREVKDRRVMKLIRKYLTAGVIVDGAIQRQRQGTPQGGPLSPLLSNILLTDLDRELEQRGHRFVRYADDVVIYVNSERAGQRVLESFKRFVEKRLKLTVNESKSVVVRPSKSTFLGYRITNSGQLGISISSRQRLIERLRQLLRGAPGRSVDHVITLLNAVLRGWANYYRLANQITPLKQIDGWVRRKLRCLLWRQWKHYRSRYRRLVRLGLDPAFARYAVNNHHGPWWNANARHLRTALPNRAFVRLGLVSLFDTIRRFQSLS